MDVLTDLERQKVRALLSRFPRDYPARVAWQQGQSLVDIAHNVEGMQPETLRELLHLNMLSQRRLRAHRDPHPRRRQRGLSLVPSDS